MLNSKILDKQKKGLEVRAFLKDRYSAKIRLANGSHYVFDVLKLGTTNRYTVRFQFVRLSFMGMTNQYRAFNCNCPRFLERSNYHHALLAIDAHAEGEGKSLPLETFGDYEMSKANRSALSKVLAA